MPELPEVETTVRQLRQYYLHKRIVKVEAKPVKIFRQISPEEFARSLENRNILAIERHGKFFYWDAEGIFPVFHLGMSGIFIRQKTQLKYPQHLHLAFYFEDGSELYFQDARKFGKIYLLHRKPQFEELGPDPLKENFTLNRFRQLLNSKSINIKTFLMDQKVIAGIGNIYASEILFQAGIHPLRKARSLSAAETKKLHRSILAIL
ncbi:MAG TPA: DNA-formamidopyrimidine glycosylase, partial [Caldithrix sp.]|nr:DNA-formamidopyrimidine glycosylase [Caldithrix sp.]